MQRKDSKGPEDEAAQATVISRRWRQTASAEAKTLVAPPGLPDETLILPPKAPPPAWDPTRATRTLTAEALRSRGQRLAATAFSLRSTLRAVVAVPASGTLIGNFLNRQRSSAQNQGHDEKALKTLLQIDFLATVDRQNLYSAVAARQLEYLDLARDRLVEGDGRAIFVLAGQLAIGAFQSERLAAEREAQASYLPNDKACEYREFQRREREGPMIRVASRDLMWFQTGDVILLDSLREILQERLPAGLTLAIFTVTPAQMLSITHLQLEALQMHSQAMRDRTRHGIETIQKRLNQSSATREEITNFYLRHGMSVARRLRVVDLDRCTFCRECETACEQRHGVARLQVAGKVLGAWGFADACRTCTDQRCVQVCGDNAIRFDEPTQEVLINEELCTGCSLCSLACPYDAIKMHVLDQTPRLSMLMAGRIEGSRKVRGETRPYVPPPSRFRVANKCDHCVGHQEQACITACTKHALFELSPNEVFFTPRDNLTRIAQPIYRPEELNTRTLETGSPITLMSAVPKVLPPPRLGVLWAAFLLLILGVITEIILRYLAPTRSLWALYLHHSGDQSMSLPAIAAYIRRKPYVPGDGLAVALGLLGTVLMGGAFLYSLFNRLPALRRAPDAGKGVAHVGKQLFGTLGFHVFAGTMGPLLVLLHTAGRLQSQYQVASVALWLMVASVIAGLAARFFASGIYALSAQARLEAATVTQELAQLRQEHAGVGEADRFYDELRLRYAAVASAGQDIGSDRQARYEEPPDESAGLGVAMHALWVLIRDELTRPLRPLRLRLSLQSIGNPTVRVRVARLISQRAYLKRQEVLLPALKPLFVSLRWVHVPSALLLVVMVFLHILNPRL